MTAHVGAEKEKCSSACFIWLKAIFPNLTAIGEIWKKFVQMLLNKRKGRADKRTDRVSEQYLLYAAFQSHVLSPPAHYSVTYVHNNTLPKSIWFQ